MHDPSRRRGFASTLGVRAAALALYGTLLASRNAAACGQAQRDLRLLLPALDATTVPLDAVLITSSNFPGVQIELHQAGGDAGQGDAGTGGVPLDIECDEGLGGGAVCLGRPRALLEPSTRYEWRASGILPDGFVPEELEIEVGTVFDPEPWQAFTTGTAPLGSSAPSPGAVSIAVLDARAVPPGTPCSGPNVVNLEYTLHASQPLVLNYAGFTPSYVMHATALSPGATPTAERLLSIPECLSPMLYDAAGNRTALPALCVTIPASAPTPEEPATTSPPVPSVKDGDTDADDHAPAFTPERPSTCAVSAGNTGLPWGWLPLALASALRRRSARRRRCQ